MTTTRALATLSKVGVASSSSASESKTKPRFSSEKRSRQVSNDKRRPQYKSANKGPNRYAILAEQRRKTLAALRSTFPDMPSDAIITDSWGDLVLVTVPFDSSNTYWRNSIIDISTMSVIKHGVPISRTTIQDEVSPLLEQQPARGNRLQYRAVFDGAQVSVALYRGTVYHITSRRLGVNTVAHKGAADVGKLLRQISSIDTRKLWPDDAETGLYYHNFIVVHPSTLNVTKSAVKEAVVYLGADTLRNLSGNVSTYLHDVASDWQVMTSLVPTEQGNYIIPEQSSEDVISYLTGELTEYQESAMVTEVDSKDRVVALHRYETKEYQRRHKVRGDVQDVLTRVLQLLTTHELAPAEDEEGNVGYITISREGIKVEDEVEFYGSTNPNLTEKFDILMDIIFTALEEALPESRLPEIEKAKDSIYHILDSLVHYMTHKPNPRHPMNDVRPEVPLKGRSEAYLFVKQYLYSIGDFDQIAAVARWYGHSLGPRR